MIAWLRRFQRYISVVFYMRKNACSVTAFDSTDTRSVQDNISTPVTAMMLTVCISTDALSSVFISPDLSDTNSFHQCCWSIMTVTACSCRLQQSVPNIPVSFCYIGVIQAWQPNRLFQSDTVSSEQSVGDNSLIQLWYHTCIRPKGATGCNSSVAFLRVYTNVQIGYILGERVNNTWLHQLISRDSRIIYWHAAFTASNWRFEMLQADMISWQ